MVYLSFFYIYNKLMNLCLFSDNYFSFIISFLKELITMKNCI